MSPRSCRQGFDIHRFSDDPTRPLVLGGVVFEGVRGLHGHSDADAIAHAVTDALLGAAGLGDIGEHFPDTDPRWKGADSIVLLRHAATLVRRRRLDASATSTARWCARRRSWHRTAHEMQQRLSEASARRSPSKGRRAEGLGALGRQEGIACWAVAVIMKEHPDTE